MTPSLDVAGLSVTFPGVGTVVDGVDLRLHPGRCLAVVGPSGAGKSVLARTLVGLAGEGGSAAAVSADRFELTGQDLRGMSERGWRRIRGQQIGFVLQDAMQALDPLRTIGAEVGETLQLHGIGDRRSRVRAALERVGLPEIHAGQRSGELSGGMRQRALIASALIAQPPVLIADEPTTALDATIAREILGLLAELRDAGQAILLITHDLSAVAQVADDVVVLDQGRVCETGPVGHVLHRPQHPRTRSLVRAMDRGAAATHRSRDTGEAQPPVVEARDVHHRYRRPGGGSITALDGVDLQLQPRQVLGIAGASGSGKSTLARMLVAAETPDHGVVELGGRPWSDLPERRRRRLRSTVRLIPQDPLGSFDPRWRAGRILQVALAQAGSSRTPAELLDLVHLPHAVRQRRPRTLSGGQRQRLAIARALAAQPAVLICDEPVSALDLTVQTEILSLLAELHHRTGTAMVLISHDLGVIRALCHRVAIMHEQRIVEEGPVHQIWSAPRHPMTRALLTAAGQGSILPGPDSSGANGSLSR